MHTRFRLLVVALLSGLGCGGEDGPKGSAGDGHDSATGGTGEGEGEGEAPLDNGPGGSLVMSASCAPDDGEAWTLAIGLGSDCDATDAGPNQPYVLLNVYEPTLLASPVGTEVSWTDWTGGSATFAPEGRNAPTYSAAAGTLMLTEWDGVDAGRPEGGVVSGWYVIGLDDGSEVGASFTGVWCGGEPMCG